MAGVIISPISWRAFKFFPYGTYVLLRGPLWPPSLPCAAEQLAATQSLVFRVCFLADGIQSKNCAQSMVLSKVGLQQVERLNRLPLAIEAPQPVLELCYCRPPRWPATSACNALETNFQSDSISLINCEPSGSLELELVGMVCHELLAEEERL